MQHAETRTRDRQTGTDRQAKDRQTDRQTAKSEEKNKRKVKGLYSPFKGNIKKCIAIFLIFEA